MILAITGGSAVAASLAVAVLIYRWFSNLQAVRRGDVTGRRNGMVLGVTPESEEERMRRFMEALGFPTDSRQSKPEPRSTPPPIRQAPIRQPQIKPVPPIVQPDWSLKPVQPVAPTARRGTPPPMPRQTQRPSADSAPAPTTVAGRIHLPELETTRVEEFHTFSSGVSAIPGEETEESAFDQKRTRGKGGEKRAGDQPLWRQALGSPEALRSAFILREILGPPRSLQRSGGVHTFPSL